MQLFIITTAILLSLSSLETIQPGLEYEWRIYKDIHAKKYHIDEELARFNIWKMNLDIIEQHNKLANQGVYSYWLRMNRFGDMTNKEFVAFYNGYRSDLKKSSANRKVFTYDPFTEVPESIDWREKGYVTPVKNQGSCGSCWAFSTTGSLEGQHFNATGELVSLSEQNLVDCSGDYGNMGCNGGLMDQAFEYIKNNTGINTEESYPYEGKGNECRFKAENIGATLSSYIDVKSKDEDALKQALGTYGPVSVAIDASHISFQLYSHGVYHSYFCSQDRLDHGVLAVGYGNEIVNRWGKKKKEDYWIVKNSWSEHWGDKGYIKMVRNKKNNCGIATSASFPIV